MGNFLSTASTITSMAARKHARHNKKSSEGICTCDPLWYLNFYELPPYLRPPPRILELPDEILFTIATKLKNNSDLRRFSLASRRFTHVAQEALVKELVLPRKGILPFLNMLCNRPDLVSKIKSVDAGDAFDVVADPGRICDLDKENLYRKCQSLVDVTNGEGHFSKIIKAIKKDEAAFGKANHRYYFDMLVALSPNIKELTVRLPERSLDEIVQHLLASPGEDEQLDLIVPFQGPALQLLQERLRVLVISETTTWWRSLKMHNISLRSLTHLVKLGVPMDALIRPNMTPTKLNEVLPPAVEHLRIQPCNKLILLWLPELGRAHLDTQLPRLRRVDVCFKTCLRSSLLLIDQGRDALTPLHGIVRLLFKTGLTINTYNGTKKNTGTLLEELDAWSQLSDFERWMTASMTQQFSCAVAKTKEGMLRQRSKEEIRFFLRGHKAPVDHRKVRKFKPSLSLDEKPRLSFGATKQPRANNTAVKLDLEAWVKIHSSYEVENLKTMAKVEPKPNNATPQQKPKYTECEFTTFERRLNLFKSRVAARFHPEEWAEVVFFSNTESEVKPETNQRGIGLRPLKPGRKRPTPVVLGQRSSIPRLRRTRKLSRH